MISLTDQSGDPARAPAPVLVTLKSSNTTVVTVPGSVEIQAGSIYTWVNYASTGVTGTATLTATSAGLQSSSATVTTYAPTSAVSLKVLISPDPVLSDNTLYNNVIVVQLMGKNSQPATAIGTSYNVSLSSSSSLVGTVPGSLIIPSGASYGIAYFQSTFQSGTTAVTASATNLLPYTAPMTTFGPVPFQISLSIYGSTSKSEPGTELPADGGNYPALSLLLTDSSGNPAVAPDNIVVQLSSSQTDILSVNTFVTISKGTIAAIVPLETTLLAGSANITASSVNLLSGSLTVTTEIPAPAKLAVFCRTFCSASA